MATFIRPLDHVRDAPFSERKVLEALRALPDDWRVFSGVRFVVPPSGPHPATEREIDLLLLHPEHGMLAIEVKGGGVEYDARAMGGFFSTDRAGGRNRVADPFQQASSALHALQALVGRDGRWTDGSVDFARRHGVAFPDCFLCFNRPLGQHLRGGSWRGSSGGSSRKRRSRSAGSSSSGPGGSRSRSSRARHRLYVFVRQGVELPG